jgi:hypothetical protein
VDAETGKLSGDGIGFLGTIEEDDGVASVTERFRPNLQLGRWFLHQNPLRAQ